MIGRERQRELLEGAFANVTNDRSCHLFTILGAAGVGKSRLAREFLAGVDATVVSGRCLSYGEGISYWPVTEVVKQLVPTGDTTGPLALILGDDTASGSPEEIAWAFRKLLEARAAERPVVVVFDDLHWGEPTFLDLVEHVADLSRDAPILLLCMARPELLDERPAWGGGKLNATTALLEPLAPDETAELLDGARPTASARSCASGSSKRPAATRSSSRRWSRSPRRAMATSPSRRRSTRCSPPGSTSSTRPSAACSSAARSRARSSIAAPSRRLHPTSRRWTAGSSTLVRKDLVRPEQAVVPDDDAYRFRHLLIRDTAYEALPKAKRAELHERFAGWLEQQGSGLVELDEILGLPPRAVVPLPRGARSDRRPDQGARRAGRHTSPRRWRSCA